MNNPADLDTWEGFEMLDSIKLVYAIVINELRRSFRLGALSGFLVLCFLAVITGPSVSAQVDPGYTDDSMAFDCIAGSLDDVFQIDDGTYDYTVKCFANVNYDNANGAPNEVETLVNLVCNVAVTTNTNTVYGWAESFSGWTDFLSADAAPATLRHGPMDDGTNTCPGNTPGYPTNYYEMDGRYANAAYIGATSLEDYLPLIPIGWGWTVNGVTYASPVDQVQLLADCQAFGNGADNLQNNWSPCIKGHGSVQGAFDTWLAETFPRHFGEGGFGAGGVCSNVEVAIQINGDAVTSIPDLLTLTAFSTDKVVLVVAIEDYPTIDANSIKWRAGPVDPFLAMFVQDTVVVDSDSRFVSYRIDKVPGLDGPSAVANWELECRAGNGDPAEYLHFGSISTWDDWGAVQTQARPCLELLVDTRFQEVEVGDEVVIPFVMGEGEPITDLSLHGAQSDGAGPFTHPLADIIVRDRFGVAIGGAGPWVTVVPENSRGTITLTSAYAFQLQFAQVQCNDSDGDKIVIRGSGSLTSFTVSTDPSCWSGSGMNYLSPSSWLPGFASMLGCLAHDLVVPDDSAVEGFMVDMRSELEDEPPFLFVAVVIDFGEDLKTSLETAQPGACFGFDISGDPNLGGAGVTESCMGDNVQTSGSVRALMALLMIGPSAIGVAGHGVSLLREK